MRASLLFVLAVLTALLACVDDREARRARGRGEPRPSASAGSTSPRARAMPPRSSQIPDDPRVTTPATTAAELAAERLIGPANAIDALAFDLWPHLRAQPGNQVFSPASIAMALAMAHAGARGDTAAEIGRVLHVEQAGERPHEAFGELLARWRGLPGVELAIANRFFGERTARFDPGYLQLGRRHFGAPLEPVDFRAAAEAARARINEWVAGETRGRIRDLLPRGAVGAESVLALANAVYFEGRWATGFDPGRTQPLEFHLDAERTVRVPTMQRTDELLFVAGDGVRVVDLPYAGEDLAMVLIVPDAVDGLPAVEARLDAATYRRWIAAMRRGRVEVRLPRFRVAPARTVDLREPLTALGLRAAWDPARADFSGIAAPPPAIAISAAHHRAMVETDEAGTVAAASTVISMGLGGMAAGPTAVHADRPFLWAIRDVRTGAILFLGRVADPSAR